MGEHQISESVRKQQELVSELCRHFPLFERVVGRFGSDMQEERIPWFFALLLAAATRSGPGACCFVLDKTPGTTAVAAVLLALVRLQDEFLELARNYAQTALHPGQRVRVKPNNLVYEYDGIWEKFPHLFRLKVLEGGTKRGFPIEEVLRLEPTDRLRPKGKGDSNLGAFEDGCLDKLLDITTCGNNSLIRNSVLLYMAQVRFAEIMNAITLAPEHNNGFDSLSGFLPWGSIGPSGELKPNDAYQVAGEPIIAVTKVPEDLALASLSATVGTKAVLVDGARGLARDLQAFDDIADQQRVVILASLEETEELKLFRDRGCPIWHMSPDEILIGEASARSRTRTSLVGATIRAADMRQRVKVTVFNYHDSVLQAIAESLEHVAVMIDDGEEVHESEEILWQLLGILFECSECCFGVGRETKDNLQAVRSQVTQRGRWMDPEVTRKLEEVGSELESIITSGTYGQEKADALLNFIIDKQNESWAVATRSPRTAESLRTRFNDLRVNMPVLSVSEIRPDRDYAGIIVPAWPNERRFTRLKAQAVTPNIRVLVYPFEAERVVHYQKREYIRERSNRMEVEKCASILGIEPRFLIPLNRCEAEPPSNGQGPGLPPIFKIEDRVVQRRTKRPAVAVEGEDSREAQLVQFFGGCHALLTEWAELPRLNQLIDGTNTGGKLTTVTVSQLSPEDFVLFRASGDKEFIRLIAEDILGMEEYEHVRALAERWKPSLWRLGTSPAAVRQHLDDHGLNRTMATVRKWLGSSDSIGPRDFRDIEFIAKVAGDMELLSIKKDVKEAISRIRGAHISAGKKLMQLLLGELGGRLNQLDEQPMLLDLDYGKAWVVQVDMVDTTRCKYPSNLVNRLLWDDDAAF